jgi:hypothetical protein
VDAQERKTYRRGALVVVPALVLGFILALVRMWMVTRPPEVSVSLDEDAMARDFAAYCDQVGWDASPCWQALDDDAGP